MSNYIQSPEMSVIRLVGAEWIGLTRKVIGSVLWGSAQKIDDLLWKIEDMFIP